ncbi:hypothetical protein OMAG_000829, partial [Candidatus Omnitrophus magneticus]
MDTQTIEQPRQEIRQCHDLMALTGNDFDLTEIINGEEVVGPSPF